MTKGLSFLSYLSPLFKQKNRCCELWRRASRSPYVNACEADAPGFESRPLHRVSLVKLRKKQLEFPAETEQCCTFCMLGTRGKQDDWREEKEQYLVTWERYMHPLWHHKGPTSGTFFFFFGRCLSKRTLSEKGSQFSHSWWIPWRAADIVQINMGKETFLHINGPLRQSFKEGGAPAVHRRTMRSHGTIMFNLGALSGSFPLNSTPLIISLLAWSAAASERQMRQQPRPPHNSFFYACLCLNR